MFALLDAVASWAAGEGPARVREAVARAVVAARSARDPALLADALGLAIREAAWRGSPDEVTALRAEHDALGLPDPLLAAELALASGDLVAARDGFRRCARAQSRSGSAAAANSLVREAYCLLRLARTDEAVAALDRADRIGRRRGRPEAAHLARAFQVVAAALRDDREALARSLAEAESLETRFPEFGDALERVLARVHLLDPALHSRARAVWERHR